jgi:hypothetical protein
VLRERFFVVEEGGLTRAQLRAGEKQGRWRRIDRCVYRFGGGDPTALDRALGALLATDGVASGRLAALLHELDAGAAPIADITVDPVQCTRRGLRRRMLPLPRVVDVEGFRCTDGLQTLIDLAWPLDDDRWEQALESALRKRLVTIDDLEAALPLLSEGRIPGVRRMRQVLGQRPPAAPPTESLLETLGLQLARGVPRLEDPVRQLEVFDDKGRFVARVDLCWPELGLFLELDGEHHKGQPVYDASRETSIVAATGWLCARLTWTEVVHHPAATARRLGAIVEQARRRPLPAL